MTDTTQTPLIDEEGRNIKTGKFEKGNVVARRKKGKRHKIHQALLDHVIKRGEQGVYFFEAVSELADKTKDSDPNLSFKCEQQLGNWAINPNFAGVQITDEEETSDSEIKTAIFGLLGIATIDDSDDEEEAVETE